MEPAYATTIAALRVGFAALGLRVSLAGADHIPRTGPVVIAANHVSYLDFALLGLAARPSRRLVRFLARHDIWRNPVAGPMMRAMRHIPVDRCAPAGAYLTARNALVRGEAVGVFPEAGVSRAYEVRALMPGAVALARETGAPLVPLVLWGGQRVFTAKPTPHGSQLHLARRRPVTVVVGPPESVPATADARERTRELGRRLQAMLADAQRSHPDQPRPGVDAPWHPRALGGSAPTPEEARRIEDLPLGAVEWR